MKGTVKRRRFLRAAWGFLLCLTVLTGCNIPEEGFSWKLWGFETHAFTVGDEEIDMRLDTSGFGRYEVTLEDDVITVLRDGEAILEGWFTAGDYAELEQEGLTGAEYRVVEHVEESPGSLLLYDEERGEYVFFTGVVGSPSGAAFYLSGEAAEEETLDRVHRVRFANRQNYSE